MRVIGAVAFVAMLTLIGCGQSPGPSPADGSGQTSAPGAEPGAVQTVDVSGELFARGVIMQQTTDSPVELCVGGVAESYPPQCGGPVLDGEFAWDDVISTQASGARWTDDSYYAVGRLDLDGGDQGTFTLTRPLALDPPDGVDPPEVGSTEFVPLCSDPTADVPEVDQVARTAGPEGMAEEQALLQVVEGLDGYVTVYLSDGGPTMNLIINQDGDLEDARAQAREVFSGPLCIVQRDLPSEADVRAAQEALHEGHEDLRVLSSGGSGTTGVLEVSVLVADQTTVDGIHEVVSQWLTPDQVLISSAFQSLNPPDGRP